MVLHKPWGEIGTLAPLLNIGGKLRLSYFSFQNTKRIFGQVYYFIFDLSLLLCRETGFDPVPREKQQYRVVVNSTVVIKIINKNTSKLIVYPDHIDHLEEQ